MNMKKIAILALALCMIAAVAITGTIAYFQDSKTATNTIVVGNITAELYESKYHRGSATGYLSITGQPNPTKDEDIVADHQTYQTEYLQKATLMPFDLRNNQTMFEECTVAKNAYVKNTSTTEDCFVRVRYMVPAKIAEYLDIYYVNSQFIKKDNETAKADARTLNNEDKTEPMIIADGFTYNAANFKAQVGEDAKQGDYYVAEFIYAERLTPGEMTLYSPISKITMVPTVTEAQIAALGLTDSKFDIKVEADVIQADGFNNALEAFGKFATR